MRGALSRHFAGLPSTFWWLWTGMFISALATFVFPFLAIFLTARGFSPARTGLLVSFYGIGIIFAGPLAGASADRFGRRPTILAALLGSAGSAATLAFLSSPFAIAIVVLLFGIFSTSIFAPVQATIADILPPEGCARAFGLIYWANNIGVGVSLVVGGALASKSWAVPFLADATTTLAFALLVWRRLPETRPPSSERAASGAESRVGYGAVLRDRRFAAFIALCILFGVAFWQTLATLAIHMTREGFSPSVFGRVLAVNTAVVALLQPFAARLTGRYRPTTVLAVAASIAGAGFGAYGLCGKAWHYALATGVFTLGEIGYMPTAAALVTELAPADLRGRYAGAYGVTFGVASFLAPLVGPATLQAFGPAVLWTGCLAIALTVSAGYVALGRALRSSVCPTESA